MDFEIIVICKSCDNKMIKIEDGRDESTQQIFKGKYPKNRMEFVCSCGKAIDIEYAYGDMLSSANFE